MFKMPDNQIEIGVRLKKIRLELGKNQEDFSAMLLGKSNKATISAYELGKMAIAPKALVVLFTTLNVSKDWLETGEGEMFTKAPDKTTPPTTYKKGKFTRLMEFLQKFDAPLAKWVATKVDGVGLDDEDVSLLEERLAQIRKNIENEHDEVRDEIKILALSKKKKDNSQ